MENSIALLKHKFEEFNEKEYDIFFTPASFKTNEARISANAQYMRCFFVDLDCKHAKDLVETDKPFASAKEAVQALDKFLEASGLGELGTPWINGSGGGVHAYWPLDRDVEIPRWKIAAENIKLLAKQCGFEIDMGVTADAARLMRIPNTINRGEKGGKQVRERTKTRCVSEGDIFKLDEIEALLASKLNGHAVTSTALALPGTRPTRQAGEATVLPAGTSDFENSFRQIVGKSASDEGCKQIAWWFANGKNDNVEGVWRGVLSIAKHCVDAEKAYPIITAVHGYDEPRMRKKIAEIKGHYPCDKFNSDNPGVCDGCKRLGTRTKNNAPFSPLFLGRMMKADTGEKTIRIDSPCAGDPIILTRPEPPFGYKYSTKGGVIFTEADKDGNFTKEVTLLPYDFYAIAILNARGVHEVQMMANRPDGVVTITVPLRSIGSKDECIKQLSMQNIVCSPFAGPKGDEKLYYYVKGSVMKLSGDTKSVLVPENMGWQKDDSFVLNERVYKPDGTVHHVPMREFKNLTNGLGQAGTLEGWNKFVNMLARRELYSHLVVGMVGMASPLMKFFPGLNGVTFHASSGESGMGKSLAVDLASSVWGSPILYRSGTGSSINALLQRAGQLNSLPLVTDEITTAQRTDPEWLPQFLLSFSQGKQKDRMEGGANKERENVATWGTMAILSSNTHGMDYLSGGRNHSSKGEILRMLEWAPDADLKWLENDVELIKSLHSNYGIVGELWVRWLVTHQDEARKVVEAVHKRVVEELNMDGNERFWSAGVAALLALTILAGPKHANLVHLPATQMYTAMKGMVSAGRIAHKSNTRSAEDLLNEYTKEFYGQMVIVKDDVLKLGTQDIIGGQTRATKIMGRVEHLRDRKIVEYYIAETELRKFCSTNSFNFKKFKLGLSTTFSTMEMRKNLLEGINGPSMRVTAVRIQMREGVETPVE